MITFVCNIYNVMPFEEIEELNTPGDEIMIWRYMDLVKLLSILEDSSLFFPSADCFEDDYEGSLTIKNFEEQEAQREAIKKYAKPWDYLDGEFIKKLPKHVCINCWHGNQVESAAMWKLYLSSDDGIAIKSSIKRLKECIIDSNSVFIGKVNYINYTYEKFKFTNYLELYFNKRKSFEHEQEIRAIVIRPLKPINTAGKSQTRDFVTNTIVGGARIEIDPAILIEEIRVSPKAPAWFVELVENIIKNRYKLNVPVVNSEMNGKPLW